MSSILLNRLYNTLVSIGFTECNISSEFRRDIVDALLDLNERLQAMDDVAKTSAKLRAVVTKLEACKS